MGTTGGSGGGADGAAERRPSDDAGGDRSLTDELRALVTIRSRVSVRDRVLPTLFTLLPAEALDDKERRFAALRELIDAGIARIDDPDHRAAAVPLFGFGPGRWRPLTVRGPEAAAAFGCGWDAYRRRRTNGVSLLDETTGALARALIGPPAPASPLVTAPVVIHPVDAPEDPVDPPDQPSDRGIEATPIGATPIEATPIDPAPIDPAPLETHPLGATPSPATTPPAEGPVPASRRRRLLLIGGALLACAALGLVALQALGSDRSSDCRLLTHERGDLPRGADRELRAWAPAFRAAGDDLGDGASRCADVLGRLHGVVTQRVSGGDDTHAALLVAVGDDHRRVIGLFADEFAQFRDLGPDEDLARTGLGLPRRRRDRSDGRRVVEFTHGTVITEPGGPSRSIHNVFWTTWQDNGGLDGPLGAPVSQRYDDNDNGLSIQEFTGGELVTGIDLPGRPTVDLSPSRAGSLPADPTGVVLRTGDGTAWLVGGDGERHWLRTSDAFDCAVAEQGASPTLRVSAAAIQALPRGEEYECP